MTKHPQSTWHFACDIEPPKDRKFVALVGRGSTLVACSVEWINCERYEHPVYGRCNKKEWWFDNTGEICDPVLWCENPITEADALAYIDENKKQGVS